MGIMDYFKRVQSITADETRQFLKEKNPEEYTLLDVRQPKEYERGHIPGAMLFPVGDIHNRLSELDPEKPVIAY